MGAESNPLKLISHKASQRHPSLLFPRVSTSFFSGTFVLSGRLILFFIGKFVILGSLRWGAGDGWFGWSF